MPPKRRAPAGGGVGKTRDWGHPEGFSLSEVEVNGEYDGKVTNVSPYGVFVDFGAVKDGLLRVNTRIGRNLKKGMELRNLIVISCEPDAGRVVLQPEEGGLQEPPVRRSQSANAPRTRAGVEARRSASQRPKQRKGRTWDHAEATPLEELNEGDIYQGVVTNVGPYGVFVDIGAVRDARLAISAAIGRRFRIGDLVQECMLEAVDFERQRLAASLPDPEAAVRDLPPKDRAPRAAAAKTQAKAKAKAKAKSRAQSADAAKSKVANERPFQQGVMSIEDLVVGSIVDGVVSSRGPYGIFVNIGCDKDALLLVPRRVFSKFRRGDDVYGMKISNVDLEKTQITVTLEDPELSADSADELPARPAAASTALPRPRSAGSRIGAATNGGATALAKKSSTLQGAPKTKVPMKETGISSSRRKAPHSLGYFQLGSYVSGFVTHVDSQGVHVDIGAANDGLLRLPRAIAKEFQAEDEVQDMTVDSIDIGAERIILALDEPELEEKDKPLQSLKAEAAPNGKAQAKAKAKGKAKAKSGAAKDWSHPGAMLLEELQVGMEVSGTVTNSGQYGVFLDIGAVKDGRLQLPPKAWRGFRVGDQVDKLIIDHIDIMTGQINLSNEDDVGGAEESEDASSNRIAAVPPQQRGKTAAVKGLPSATGRAGTARAMVTKFSDQKSNGVVRAGSRVTAMRAASSAGSLPKRPASAR